MEITPSRLYSESLELGKVLNVNVLSGSAVVEGYLDNVKIVDSTITTSSVFGPYVNPVYFKVFQLSGTSDVTEILSSNEVAKLTDAQKARPDITGVMAGTEDEAIVLPSGEKIYSHNQRTSALSRLIAYGPSDTVNGNFTFVEQHQAFGPFYGVEIAFMANGGATSLMEQCKVAPCPTDLNDGTSLTFINSTFNGATTFTPQAGSGSGLSAIQGPVVKSDFLPIVSVPRTDFPSEPPLLQIRSKFAGATSLQSLTSNTYADLVADGVKLGGALPSADVVTNPNTASTLTRNASWRATAFVKFYYTKPTKNIVVFADSLGRGQGSSLIPASGAYSAELRALLAKNQEQSDYIYTLCNYAVSGQLHNISFINAVNFLKNDEPIDILIIKAHSPNDGYNTQAIFDQCFARTLKLIEIGQLKAKRIIVRGPNRWSQTNERTALAIAYNERLKALRYRNVVFIDEMAIMGVDPTNSNRTALENIVSVSDQHYNDTGYALLANEIKKYL